MTINRENKLDQLARKSREKSQKKFNKLVTSYWPISDYKHLRSLEIS